MLWGTWGDSWCVLCRARSWSQWYPFQSRIFYNSDSNWENALETASLQDRKESGELDMQHPWSSTDLLSVWSRVWIQLLLGQRWWQGAPKGTEQPIQRDGCMNLVILATGGNSSYPQMSYFKHSLLFVVAFVSFLQTSLHVWDFQGPLKGI